MPAVFTRETARMRMVISILTAGGLLLASCQETGWPTAAEVVVQCSMPCSLYPGERISVLADAYDHAGDGLNGPWTWSSSDTRVATVLGSGTTATVAAVSVGQTTITATYGGGGSGFVTVTVLPVE
jgi:hypothetical protein